MSKNIKIQVSEGLCFNPKNVNLIDYFSPKERKRVMAMNVDKIQTQVRVSSTSPNVQNPYTADDNGNMIDGHGRICGSVDYETGIVSLRIPPAPPINPASGKPYFKINKSAWDGEWVVGEVRAIPSSEWGGDNE